MKALVLRKITHLQNNKSPLDIANLPVPEPKENEVLIKVSTCGVCHTELDEIEGRTPPPNLPIVFGHQVVGRVVKIGGKVTQFKIGDSVGIAWIYSACGICPYCKNGNENLCP